MIRRVAPLVLLVVTACAEPAPAPWHAWAAPENAPIRVVVTSSELAGFAENVLTTLEVREAGDERTLTLRVDENHIAGVRSAFPARFEEWAVANETAREFVVRTEDGAYVRSEPPDLAPLLAVLDDDAAELVRSREWSARLQAKCVGIWHEWGVPWLALAEAGGGETVMRLPVVGYEVPVTLAVEPLRIEPDGTGVAEARYSISGVEARDLAGFELLRLRRDDSVAWAHAEVEFAGTITVTVDLAERRPTDCNVVTVTRSAGWGDAPTESRSTRAWTFLWD